MNPVFTVEIDASKRKISASGLVAVGEMVDVVVSGLDASEIPSWEENNTEGFTGPSLRFRLVAPDGKDLVRFPLASGDSWTENEDGTLSAEVDFNTAQLRCWIRDAGISEKVDVGIIIDSIVDAMEYGRGAVKVLQWKASPAEDPTILPDWRETLRDLNAAIVEISGSVETAQNAAASAASARDTALEYKGAAETAANNALSSKSAAEGFKDTAQTAAGTATTKAREAATSANTAVTKAGEAAASATEAGQILENIETAIAGKAEQSDLEAEELRATQEESELAEGLSAANKAISENADAIDQLEENKADKTELSALSDTISAEAATREKKDDAICAKIDKEIADRQDADALKADKATTYTKTEVDTKIGGFVDGAVYDSTAKKILLKHDTTTVAEIDATDFIKDGMVSSVEITGGNLVITFNTDAGLEPIEILLTDIFDPANYYTKTQADTLLSGKLNNSGDTTHSGSIKFKQGSNPRYTKITDTGITHNPGLVAGGPNPATAFNWLDGLSDHLNAYYLSKSGGAVTGPVLINSENASLVSPLTLGFNFNPEHIENTLDIIRAGSGDIYLRIYDTTLADVVQLKLPRTSGTFALLSDIYTALQQIAPAWESGTEYPKNALVTYNGVVYQNTSGATIQSATTPDTSGSGWTVKSVSDLFLPLTGGTVTGVLTVGPIPATAAELRAADPNGTTVLILKENGNQLVLSGSKIWWKRYDWQNGIEAFFPVASGTLALAAPSPTAGNFAALDAQGNPTDSGVKASDKLDSTSAAPEFSTSSTYAVDEHCTYNGKLYRCTTAVTTAGAWDASKWTADDMTTPDATLDVTAAKQLRVVAADGTVLWAQGYDIASTSSVTLSNEALNKYAFDVNATSAVSLTLPTPLSGKVGDFVLDVTNPALNPNDPGWQTAFDSTATYAVGDLCSYNSKLYRCTVAVETAGEWTGSTNWEEAIPYFTLSGLGTTFNVVVPLNENLTDMLTFAPGDMAELYFTQTAFTVNDLPAWKIVRQDVEAAV